MVSFLRSKEKAHAQTQNKEELTRKKEPESKFDKIEEEDKPENDDYDEEEYREGHGAIGETRRWERGGVGCPPTSGNAREEIGQQLLFLAISTRAIGSQVFTKASVTEDGHNFSPGEMYRRQNGWRRIW